MENEKKTEMKAKKEWLKPETKTGLIAAGLLLLSVVCLYLVAYSNQITGPGGIVGGIVGGIGGSLVGGIVGVIFSGIGGSTFGVFVGVIGGGIVGGIVGVIFGGIVGGIVGGIGGGIGGGIDDEKERLKERIKMGISLWTLPIFLFIFLFPFVILVVPLSKYHNYRQIERDNKITEVLQIMVLEEGVKILLPDQYAKENAYLKKCFSLGWEGEKNKKAWKELIIPRQEGDKHWFYATLPFPEKKPEKKTDVKLELSFDHAWRDYVATKDVLPE